MKSFGRGPSAWDQIRAEKAAEKERRMENLALGIIVVSLMTLGAVAAELTQVSVGQVLEALGHKQPDRPQDTGKKLVAVKPGI